MIDLKSPRFHRAGGIIIIGVTRPPDSILASSSGLSGETQPAQQETTESGLKSKAVLPDVLA
jgi:hypothetical protein